jgi:hypothetical protein
VLVRASAFFGSYSCIYYRWNAAAIAWRVLSQPFIGTFDGRWRAKDVTAHCNITLDGDLRLAPSAVEQRDSRRDAFFRRAQRGDERLECLAGVFARKGFDALWAPARVSGLPWLERRAGARQPVFSVYVA